MTPARGPAYRLDELVCACGSGAKVYIWPIALKTARDDFKNLPTAADVKAFVHGELGTPRYLGTNKLELYKGPPPTPLVDDYSFVSGMLEGYLAFYRDARGNWIIKSFKKNLVQTVGNDPLKHSPFSNLLPGNKK